MPVSVTTPIGTASPKTWVSRSNSPIVTPPSARTVPAAWSTLIDRIDDRSTTSPSLQTATPETLWPPARTARGS